MMRRGVKVYVALLLLRLYLALSKSYIHPDEMFQGSEIVVGDILRWNTIRTWEFKGLLPIRSIVPIYLFQAPAIYFLRFLGVCDTHHVFYALRVQQYMWSIALDGLVYLLTNQVSNVVLFASSYTTLTYLTHTFSNGWESLLVLLMLKADSHPTLSLFMGVIAALGLFTRPSFIFFMIPLAYTHSRRIFKVSDDDDSKRIKLNVPEIGFLVYSAATFTLAVLAIIALDTWYYVGHVSLDMYEHSVVLTVLNNFKYNSNIENLAHHGLHPHYLHLINAVALLGPALFMIPRHQVRKNLAAACMATGFLGLSCIPHQEARFLLPCTTLFFTTLRTKQFKSWFLILWVAFNSLGAIGFGILHQSGVIPSALFIAQEYPTANVTFTKCYPAPVSLLGPTVTVTHAYGDSVTTPNTKLVVTPVSNKSWNSSNYELIFRENWHVNLDDFDVLGLDVFLNRGMGVFLEKQSPSPPLSQ